MRSTQLSDSSPEPALSERSETKGSRMTMGAFNNLIFHTLIIHQKFKTASRVAGGGFF